MVGRISSKPLATILVGGLFIAVIWSLLGQWKSSSTTAGQEVQKIHVTASIYPLADVAKNVGGSHVEVATITPTGAEPHDYAPTPQDVVNVYQANLVLLNGSGVDAWGDRLLTDLQSKHVHVIRMSDALSVLSADTSSSEEGLYDPHIWLDPTNVEREADLVTNAFIAIDPSRAIEYANNRDRYKAKLAQLDTDYRAGLMRCQTRKLVTSHNAFRYLARRYGLTSLYLQGLSPEDDPSPQILANLADQAKREHIAYIFFETLVSPKLAETLANEVGAKTLLLNPIEGLTQEEAAVGKDYLQLMYENLAQLRLALRCT